MGSLRLPAAPAERLKRDAKREGLTFAEALRRAVDLALRQPDRLAAEGGSGRRNATVRLGAFAMPAELAEGLNAMAQGLGVPVSEVVRRAVETAAVVGVDGRQR